MGAQYLSHLLQECPVAAMNDNHQRLFVRALCACVYREGDHERLSPYND